MKNLRYLILTGLTLGLSGFAVAAPVCGTSGILCETPVATTQSTIVISAAHFLGLESLNSVGPNGNQTTSNYFFAVTTTDLGSTTANGTVTDSGTGTTVVGVTPTHPASTTPSSTVGSGQVQGTKGGTTYWIYAQACPAGIAANGTNCSSWAKVDTSQVATSPYPTTVFAAPVKPTDATVNSINVRTNVPNGDVSNVSDIVNITIDDLITPANSQAVNNILFTGNPGPYPVTNSLFTNGFIPNTKYQYTAQVAYPWDNVPIAGPQTEGPFWTTPLNPGPVTIVAGSITHCSVTVNVQRSAAVSPTNPTYTKYQACVAPGGTPCSGSAVLPGSGVPTDNQNFVVTPLAPGTLYQAEALALTGNGDGTQTGWTPSSGYTTGPSFTTAGFSGTFSITNITTNSADFNFSGLDLSGITGYQMFINNVAFGPQVNSPPVSPIALTGLTSNTQYIKVQIKLIEASCSSLTPPAGLAFTTDAATPTSFGLTAPTPNSLSATWTDAVNPPANTAYQVQYCTDAGFTQNCQIFTTIKGATSATLTAGVNPSTTYFAHVLALSVGGGNNSPYSNSASATTPPNNSSMSISPNPATVVAGANQVFTATVTDFQGNPISGATVTWTLPGGGGTLGTPNPAASITFTAGMTTGSFTIQAARPGYTSVTATINITPAGQVPTTIMVAPSAATVSPGASTTNTFFTATVTDQFGNPISGQAVNWSINGVGNSVSTANGVQTGVTAGSTPGSFTLTASLPGATNGTATITIPTQILTTVKVCAIMNGVVGQCGGTITIQTLVNQLFVAQGFDQFGNPMTLTNVTWKNANGNGAQASFSSPSIIPSIVITATVNGVPPGSITVIVNSLDVSGAFAYPVPFKASAGVPNIIFSGLGNQWTLHIYSTSGRRIFDTQGTTNTFTWTIKNTSGESIASGVYFYLIESPQGKKNGKLIIIQ